MLSTGFALAFLAISCALAGAQNLGAPPTNEARDLLVHADAVLFTAASVRLVGTRTTESTAPSRPTEIAFTQTLSRDGRARVEEGSGATYWLQIFDGSTLSTYSGATNNYSQTAVKSAPPTMLSLINLLRFGSDSWNIASAALLRTESIDFGGANTPCEVVRAAYSGAPGNPAARNVMRTVWIAHANSIILRDSWEAETPVATGMSKGRTVFTYSAVQWDLPLSADLFVFHPATGDRPVTAQVPATASGDPLSKAAPSNGAGVGEAIGSRSVGPTYGAMVKVRPPVAIRKPAAAYTAEARSARYQGTVLVSVDVDESGRAAAVRLVRGLGMGLDLQAVEAARQWQFTPGTRDGVPARMTRPYEVEFRLADGGPWSLAGAHYQVQEPNAPHPMPLTMPLVRQYVSPEASACSNDLAYVSLHLHIDSKGNPSGVEALNGPFAALGPAAVSAVKSWTFIPMLANGKPIRSDATIVLECRSHEAENSIAAGTAEEHAVGGGVSTPTIIYKVEPDYSAEARKAKVQGMVTIYLVVGPDGRPTTLSVTRSIGFGLDEKAMEGVAQWRFRPGMKDGKAVSVKSTVQVNFKLL